MRTLRLLSMPLIILLFCFNFSSLALAQEKLSDIVKRIQPSTVVVLNYDKEGNIFSQGSGFFISQNGDIITNLHVLQGASRAEVKTSKGEVFAISRIVAEDIEADLIRASVNMHNKVASPLSASNAIPEVGERVIVIGSPLGLEHTVSDGIVSAVRYIPEFGNIIQITAPISSGSSGSPVVNMKGEVIGVAAYQLIEGQSLNFAIPGEKVINLKQSKGEILTEWSESREGGWLASADGLYYLGLNSLWIDDYKTALFYFEDVVKKNTNYVEAYFLIGYCYGKIGRYSEAIVAYKQAIRINPDDALAHYYLGLNYSSLGRYNEAIEACKQAIRINPDYAEAHYFLGVAYSSLGRYNETIEAHKQAIRINPDYAEAHNDLGLAYSNLGRYNEAIEACKQAIRINPDYAEAHYFLGGVFLIIGDKGSALDEYKIIKDLDNDLANKLFNLIYK